MTYIYGGSESFSNTKQVAEWSTDDVAYWVGEQGTWAKGVYDERFKVAGIDGNLLLKMREEDLIGPPINMALSLHRRVLMQSLAMIYSQKKLTSEDFWSYKVFVSLRSFFFNFPCFKVILQRSFHLF